MVAEEVCDCFIRCDEASERGEGFGECSHDEVDIIGYSLFKADSASALSEDSDTVGFVDHHGGVVFLRELSYRADICDVAFH